MSAGLELKEAGPAAPSVAPVSAPEAKEQAPEPGARLLCKRCDHVITDARARISVDGSHAHVRVNPSGYAFDFGCFSRAPGCVVTGPPTAEASWFAGHAWRFALCGGCKEHLGWLFEGQGSFFALVLSRLREGNSDQPG